MPPLPDLTWPALLARWTDFAQSSLAFPRTTDGDRWRNAVPAIIGLQAVTFALAEVDTLAADERALARDRAAVLIRRHEAEFRAAWPGETLHLELETLLADAKAALAAIKG